jgi:hypothetical protein
MIEPLKFDWKESGRWGKFKAQFNRVSRLLNGVEVTSGGRAELTDDGIKFHLGHQGPFWCSPAGLLTMEIAYGELRVGLLLELIEYNDPEDPLTFTVDHLGAALVEGDYILGLRVCCNPSTGTFDDTWFAEPVLWVEGDGTPATATHPTQYTWQSDPLFQTYVHCEYMILAKVSIQFNSIEYHPEPELVFSTVENVWQNPHMYIPMWHFNQTSDPTTPIDFFQVQWYIPVTQSAQSLYVPIGQLTP